MTLHHEAAAGEASRAGESPASAATSRVAPLTLKQRIKPYVRPFADLAIPMLRAYLKNVPGSAAKRWIWQRGGAFVAKGHHPFVEDTEFGCKIRGDTTDLIQRFIYMFGVWEPNLTTWLSRRLRPGDIFVDVGANIGYYVLLASRLVGPNGKVVAIEASPATFKKLNDNLRLNDVHNVRALNIAASAERGSLKIYEADAHNIGETSTVPLAGLSYACDIDAAPLGEILSSDELSNARIIKIDVEGAEWSVIAGLAPALARLRDDVEIVVEVAPDRLGEAEPEKITALFTAAGFNAYQSEIHSALSYVPPRVYTPPTRVRAPITKIVDLVFSRVDAATL